MTHPIERTLALLHDVMIAHGDALKSRPPGRPPPPALLADRRSNLVLRLLHCLEGHTGIEVGPAITEKLGHRLKALSLGDLDASVTRLEQLPPDDTEWQTLVESLTVPETYLMRDPAQMALVAAQLPKLIEAAAGSGSRRIRLWSVGCATGEEAYSLAVLALRALVAAGEADETPHAITVKSPWQVDIVGADIAPAALARAGRGIYATGPLSAFRSLAPELLRYFPPGSAARTRQVRADIRAAVRFEPFNLVRDPPPGAGFDLVACRNVLIYLSMSGRRRALETLRRSVRQGGYLLLGATDDLADVGAFETIWGEGAVIYRCRSGHE